MRLLDLMVNEQCAGPLQAKRKALTQHDFLGMANFYNRLIAHCAVTTVSLTPLALKMVQVERTTDCF